MPNKPKPAMTITRADIMPPNNIKRVEIFMHYSQLDIQHRPVKDEARSTFRGLFEHVASDMKQAHGEAAVLAASPRQLRPAPAARKYAAQPPAPPRR